MPYNLPQAFNIGNTDPIDARIVVSSSYQRLAFSTNNVFEGLTVYETGSGKYFILVDKPNWNNEVGWAEVDISGSGFGNLQNTLASGNSASLGISSSYIHVGEVSFIPVKLTKDTSQDYIVASGSGLVIQPITGASPTAVEGSMIYSASNFYVGIEI